MENKGAKVQIEMKPRVTSSARLMRTHEMTKGTLFGPTAGNLPFHLVRSARLILVIGVPPIVLHFFPLESHQKSHPPQAETSEEIKNLGGHQDFAFLHASVEHVEPCASIWTENLEPDDHKDPGVQTCS